MRQLAVIAIGIAVSRSPWWWPPMALRIVTATSTLLLGACGSGTERWEPRLLDIAYDVSGRSGTVALDVTSPTLEVNEGDKFSIKRFNVRMLPVIRSSSGIVWITVHDIPPIHQSDLNMVVRLAATLRRIEGSAHCWDVRNQVMTDWKQAEAGIWSFDVSSAPWLVGKTSDQIKFNVMFKQQNSRETDSTKTEDYIANYLDLKPSDIGTLRYNSSRSIFMYLYDWIRGDTRACDN